MPINLVFVHGWSVINLNTYGQLPLRLRAQLAAQGDTTTIHEIWLGRYISFHDEVRLSDISRAFQAAINDELADLIKNGEKFACITHSTGGPVVRDWQSRYGKGKPCPMSHLIMLAPANFGSALAQLGKGTISRLKSWVGGVEPGQGVLDWLELGSQPAWELNTDWICNGKDEINANSFYPFVLIGQRIDRHFYDNLNSYTGEIGSDGVVRSAAANLNAALVVIKQQDGDPVIEYHTAPATPFLIVENKSHSGDTMGILTSPKADPAEAGGLEVATAIIRCLKVANDADYAQIIQDFATQTATNQQTERLENVTDRLITLTHRYFIHDRYCMVIFRVTDNMGYPIRDFDLLFTSGDNNPNHLPEGFFSDRQQNSRNPETITYFVNYDIMKGAPPVTDGAKTVRETAPGVTKLGLQIKPRPDQGFVRYRPLEIIAQPEFFDKMVKPNTTILVDIRLQRLISKEVFRLEGPVDTTMPDDKTGDFCHVQPGDKFIC